MSYDEEVGCLGVRGLIRDLEENGIRPAGCVVGEPTSMQPIIAHKGTHRFRCAVHGREAHSSYVTHGVNAIEYAARLVVFIRQIADRLAQIEQRDYGFTVPYSTLSTGVIHGGIAANVVPKDCEFQFDMRTLPQASPDALYQEIRALRGRAGARDAARSTQKSGIDLEWVSQTVGLAAAETDAIVQWAMQLSRNHRWARCRTAPKPDCFRRWAFPRVICGPGDIAEAHRPNEFVALEQLAQCETIHGSHSRYGISGDDAAIARASDAAAMTVVKGACPHDCPDTCALDVHVRDGVALKVTGSAEHAPDRRSALHQGGPLHRAHLPPGSLAASACGASARRGKGASRESVGRRRSPTMASRLGAIAAR